MDTPTKPRAPTIYGDTETWPIGPSNAAPPIACLQIGDAGPSDPIEIIPALHYPRGYAFAVREMLAQPRIVFQSAAFDMACLALNGFAPEVFKAYDELRVECTIVNQKLIDIAFGRNLAAQRYGLDALLERHGAPFTADKGYHGRCTYSEVAHLPVEQWELDRIHYAREDVRAARFVDQSSEHVEAYEAGILECAAMQARADFCLRLMTCVGVCTDQAQVERYMLVVERRLAADLVALQESGLVRKDGTKNNKAAQTRMLEVTGGKCRMTDGGKKGIPQPSLDKEASEESGDYLLIARAEYGSAAGRKARIAILRHDHIQPSFDVLKETSRTSCRDPKEDEAENVLWGAQVHNCPREAGYRECFVGLTPEVWHRVFGPDYGLFDDFECGTEQWVMSSEDFKFQELVQWSQRCYDLLGRSDMLVAINAGKDPHAIMGATLLGWDYDYMIAALRGDHGDHKKKEAKDARQVCKPGNFGLPGGMGVDKFWATCKKQGVPVSMERAQEVVDAWLATWWEAREWKRYWSDRCEDGDDGEITVCLERVGFFRGAVRYCAAANTNFQGPGAFASKAALWAVTWECYMGTRWNDHGRRSELYGALPWNMCHDEILAHHRPDLASVQARRLADCMVEAAQPLTPDVKVECEPVVIVRWAKNAETPGRYIKDSSLLLPLWEPSGIVKAQDADGVEFEIPYSGWAEWFELLEYDLLS